MKAIIISQAGEPDVLRIAERPVPVPIANEVLIQVRAAGVNRPDISQRKGHYPPPAGASPDIPGLEVAGVVMSVGESCHRFKPGDVVCALVAGGGYADFCVAPEGQCLPIPRNLNFVEAASLPETFFTVWSNVFDRAQLRQGETLLVHGGSSGIGSAAIQLGKAFGAKVIVTAGTPEKCNFCMSLGAELAINYRIEKFEDGVMKVTNKNGANVILDMVGGAYTQRNLQILAEDGRLVLINFMGGEESIVKLGILMRRRLTITGSTLRPRDTAFKSAIANRLEQSVWPLIESGIIRPVIDRVFTLQEAPAAHRLMESGAHMGKIVLTVEEVA